MSPGEPNACCDSSASSARCSGRHRREHPLRGGGARGEGVDELVDGLGLLGEEVAVPVHEVAELLGRVLAPGVGGEEVVEVAEHLLDALAVLGGGVLEGLLHPREALVEQLAAEEVLDLLVLLAGVAAAPRVVGQLGDRGRGGRRGSPSIRISAKPGVVVEVSGELLALGEHGLVEQAAHLVERAAERVLLQQLAPALRHLPGQLVEADPGCRALAQQLAHGPLG